MEEASSTVLGVARRLPADVMPGWLVELLSQLAGRTAVSGPMDYAGIKVWFGQAD